MELFKIFRRKKATPPEARPYQPITSELPTDAMLQMKELNKGLLDHMERQKRSLMHKQKLLCNGEKTGFECQFYWRKTFIVESQNPDVLKRGDCARMCTKWGLDPDVFGDGREGMSPDCTMYVKDENRPYKAEAEEYKPLTPYQIELIQAGACDDMDYEASIAFLDKAQAEKDAQPAEAPTEAPKQTVSVDAVLNALPLDDTQKEESL